MPLNRLISAITRRISGPRHGSDSPSPPATSRTEPEAAAAQDVPGVERWVPVSLRWLGHRAEPLITERLGGYDLPLDSATLARQEYWAEAGYDAEGRPVARRQVSRHSGPAAVEVSIRENDGSIRVDLEDGGVARTFFDASGRATRTVYEEVDSDRSEETYVYDDAGRLVAIDESPEIGFTEMSSVERYNMGGRVEILHDDIGLERVVARDGRTVWERATRPWEERLAELADPMVASGLAALAEVVADANASTAAPEAYGLAVTYSGQGELYLNIAVGLEQDRVDAGVGEDGAIATLYIENVFSPITIPIEDRAGATLMQEMAINQPEDPYRAAAEALACRLAISELPGLAKTADFVAWAADVDEGLAEKVISIEQCNAPASLARWRAGWGGAVLPFTDDAVPVITAPEGSARIAPDMVRRALEDD